MQIQPILAAAGVPIPNNFDGCKKSYSLNEYKGGSTVQVLSGTQTYCFSSVLIFFLLDTKFRWFLQQLHINTVQVATNETMKVGSGSTIAVRKSGGWEKAWALALERSGASSD